MPTIYDVFAAVIKHGPCKHKDLPFTTPVYAQLDALVKKELISKSPAGYTPQIHEKAQAYFLVIKESMSAGLNYNILLSEETFLCLQELMINLPNLRPMSLRNNPALLKKLTYLETHQFMLVAKKRPRLGVLLAHPILKALGLIYGKTMSHPIPPVDTRKAVMSLPPTSINPYGEEYFAQLAGSAQLEGATVSVGETTDLITNNIYPDKPAKDVQMIKNLNVAMRYLIEHLQEEITLDHIRAINGHIMHGLHAHAGLFKVVENKIQGNPSFKTTPPREVPRVLEEYCSLFNSITTKEECLEAIGGIHNAFHRIHPFADGNSRTTRVLINWLLAKHHLPMVVLRAGSMPTYMSLTKLAQVRDDRVLKEFFWKVLVHEELTKNIRNL